MNQCMRIFVILGTVSYLTGCGTLNNFMGTQDNAPAAMAPPVSNTQPTNQPATNMAGQESLNPATPADATAATKAQTNPSVPRSNVIPVVSQPPQNQPSAPSAASSTGEDNNTSEVRSTPDTE